MTGVSGGGVPVDRTLQAATALCAKVQRQPGEDYRNDLAQFETSVELLILDQTGCQRGGDKEIDVSACRSLRNGARTCFATPVPNHPPCNILSVLI
ncbi:hypothetical protein ACFQFQ_14275 [Sulfitobacter porphyrae]|uniref:Uncharacterized protein n=1 Tax=Sulfitobacter porphyrae TaxID=1246864 RepID=A0ABW2B5E7_9RHOB|nr:hypothetical protein GCM10007928_01630 [Sulfitobacter porphyrae]